MHHQAPISLVPGIHDYSIHITIAPQVLESIHGQHLGNASLLPNPSSSTSRTRNVETTGYNHKNVTLSPGLPHVSRHPSHPTYRPAANQQVYPYSTSPANTNSAMGYYSAGPTDVEDRTTRVLKEIYPPNEDMSISSPALVLCRYQPPQPYEWAADLPGVFFWLNTRDPFADPWNAEFANKFPASGRREALVNTLIGLETLLGAPQEQGRSSILHMLVPI